MRTWKQSETVDRRLEIRNQRTNVTKKVDLAQCQKKWADLGMILAKKRQKAKKK